jgi:hypothetical protein
LREWNCIVALQYRDVALQQKRYRFQLRILPRRIEVQKTYLTIAAAVISIAGATAGFAAELPSYEAKGLPISAVQVRVLGAADVREQSPVLTSTATAHQLSVLTPRTTRTAETAAPAPTTGRAIR